MDLQIKGKTLVVDWASDAGKTSAFSIGTIKGIASPRLITVPYMMWYNSNKGQAKVVLTDGTYIFTHLDFYKSNSFAWSGVSQTGDDWAICNGDAVYFPNTAGKTAPLMERQFITISKNFDEVLPNIPNPPSPYKEEIKNAIYFHDGGAKHMEEYVKMMRNWKTLGIDNAFFSLHEAMWTQWGEAGQGPQAFTFTTDLSEDVDRDQFIANTKEVRDMGYHMGPYFNPSDYNPLSQHFDEKNLARSVTGDPMFSWPPCYGPKTRKAVDMANWFLPIIAKEFNLNCGYMDVLTNLSPWCWVDNDSRVPGSSVFSTNYLSNCKFAQLAHKYIKGPLFSEGSFQWWYAGLHEGSYGWNSYPYDGTPIVDFRLLKMNPLMSGVAAGPVHKSDAPDPLSKIKGTILWADIASAMEGPAHLMYYLVIPMQQRYVMEEVDQIRYERDGVMYKTSDAIENDAVKDGHIYVRYKNGFELAVNDSETKDWKVNLANKEYLLPPGGWAARQGDEMESYALKVDGKWVAFTMCPEWEVVVPFGNVQVFRSIVSSSGLVLRLDDPRGIKLIPFDKFKSVAVKFEPRAVRAYSSKDVLLGNATFEKSDMGWDIGSVDNQGVSYYIIERY